MKKFNLMFIPMLALGLMACDSSESTSNSVNESIVEESIQEESVLQESSLISIEEFTKTKEDVANDLAEIFNTIAEYDADYDSYYILLYFQGILSDSPQLLNDVDSMLPNYLTLDYEIEQSVWSDGEAGYFVGYKTQNDIFVDIGTYIITDKNNVDYVCLQFDIYESL